MRECVPRGRGEGGYQGGTNLILYALRAIFVACIARLERFLKDCIPANGIILCRESVEFRDSQP